MARKTAATPPPPEVPSPSRVTLPRLAADAYRHPSELAATRALSGVPGFDKAIGYLSRHSIERILFSEYMASGVRVGPTQCARLHTLLEDACAVLDLPLPTLFLAHTSVADTFAFGIERPTVVLSTELWELLSDDELRAAIGHELGHLHCGHANYRLMGILLEMASRVSGAGLGLGELLSLGIQVALQEWLRKAELSADRAALLVAQDPEVVFSVLFKRTGGNHAVIAQMDPAAFLAQADDYDAVSNSKLDKLYTFLLESHRDHPIPVLRAREIRSWGASESYQALLRGEYTPRDQTPQPKKIEPRGPQVCPHCGTVREAAFSFCTQCGKSLSSAAPEGDNHGG